MYLSFLKGLFLMFLSLMDEWHPPPESAWSAFLLTTVKKFCLMLFTGHSPRAAINRHLYQLTSVLKTEEPFPNFFWRKGTIFGAKGFGQSSGLFYFLPLYFIQATTMTYIPFFVQRVIGYGVQVAFDFHSDCFSGQSLGLVSSNTEG